MADIRHHSVARLSSTECDYQPLDLSSLLMEIPTDRLLDELPSGQASLRGLPFVIGRTNDPAHGPRSFAAFGPGFHRTGGSVGLPRSTRQVVIAHATLDSDSTTDSLLGQAVANYTFRFVSGRAESVTIRHRFEIGCLGRGEPMTAFGTIMAPVDVLTAVILGKPFVAFADQYDSTYPRLAGPWVAAGRRAQEGIHAYPRGLKLWCWTCPADEVVQLLEIGGANVDFIIAGITVSSLNEDPIARDVARPIRLLPTPGHPLPAVESIDVSIDRGLATYPMRLSDGNDPGPHQAPGIGYGESIEASTGAYCRVSGIPSATLSVRGGDETLGIFNWGELVRTERASSPKVTIELIDDRETWVHTTVLDRDTGRPVPCRIHFRSSAGVPFPPHGHHAHLNFDLPSWHIDVGGDLRLGSTTYAYIDGQCQGWLPVGDVMVEIARGFEYEPVRTTVRIEPSQHSLTLEIGRWTCARRSRWYSGDTHVHFLSPTGAHLEAAAEGLDVVNLLQAQWGRLFTNIEDWTGAPSVSERFGTIVHVGQENRQHMLGHVGLLGLTKPIMPWSSDGAAEAELGGAIETTLSEWADRCHDQGGTVTITHFGYSAAEMAAMVATGRADAAEMLYLAPYFHEQYYRHLNAGYQLPLVGGSDKMTGEVPVGVYRTYVNLDAGEEFTYETWCANLRRGRTFLSAGPLLDLDVDGVSIGGLVRLPRSGGHVSVRAEAQTSTALPIFSLQLIVNGQVAAEVVDLLGATSLRLDESIGIAADSWIALRTGGPRYFDAPLTRCAFRRGIFAHTSPIYVTTSAEWSRRDPSALQYMLTLTQGCLEYVRTSAVKHPAGRRWHPSWAPSYQESLERPFIEGLSAISERLNGD